MVPGYCGVAGVAGLLTMVLLWVALLVTVIWGIRRLFPDRPRPMDPVPPAARTKLEAQGRDRRGG